MKHLNRIFPVIFLLALGLGSGSLVGQTPEKAPSEKQAAEKQATGKAESHASGSGSSHDVPVMEMSDQDLFITNFSHLIPHALVGGKEKDEHGHAVEGATDQAWAFYDSNLFQAIAVILILLIFPVVKNSFGGQPGSRSGGFVRVFRGWCHWLRDEVVYSVMGKDEGRAWAPFFLFLFFFLAFLNLLGLVPVVGRTATASFYVTGTMAAIVFFCMLFFGFKKQGVVKFFVNLLPHGLPVALIPLMAVIEFIGLLIKPFALTVRLFANMLGGHMVMYAFLGMIFLFAKLMEMNTGLSTLTAIPAVGMSVFISIIEGFVALLQAYIFTYLSVIFVQQAMHPDH